MKIPCSKNFMGQNKLEADTLNESELHKIWNYTNYPRDSKLPTENGFINFGDGSIGGSHRTCFYIKDNKSFFFDSFGWAPDTYLINQLPQTITFNSYKIQDKNSRLCGSCCLYFFHLIKTLSGYDAISIFFLFNQMPANVFGKI